MAISLKDLKRKKTLQPPRILIYGVQGVGKTRWAASCPRPAILDIEDGAGILAAERDTGVKPEIDPDLEVFDLSKETFANILETIEVFAREEHDFQTLIIDSVDWLEPKLYAHVCALNKWADIEAPGYGKGYAAALDIWRKYIDALNVLRNEKNMVIVQIAHAKIKQFKSPITEPYDRYEIKLQEKAAALLQEHSDCVFFGNFEASVVKTETGFKKTISRGVGAGNRVLHTEERPSFLAKNRMNLPFKMPMDVGFNGMMDIVSGKLKIEDSEEE